MKKTRPTQIAALAARIRSASGEIQLMPAGWFTARDGRKGGRWFLDRELADKVIELAQARETPFVIDYEHQTLFAETSGQAAPAAGWFSDLEWRDGDGLYAVDVQWTDRASTYIANDEYRYLSPVFGFNPETGAVQELYMAAVTNNPAIDGIADVAAARFHLTPETPTEETTTVDEKTLKALGLSKDASEKDISDAVAALKAKADQADQAEQPEAKAVLNTKTLEALGLDDQADAEAVNTAVSAMAAARAKPAQGDRPNPEEYVPIGVVKQLQEDLAALRADHTQSEVESLISEGLEDGRLVKSMEDWARDLGKQNIAALRSYLDSAKPIAALRSHQTRGMPTPGADSQLTASELAVCKATGVSEADYLKAKEAQKSS